MVPAGKIADALVSTLALVLAVLIIVAVPVVTLQAGTWLIVSVYDETSALRRLLSRLAATAH